MSSFFHYNEPLSNTDTGQGLIGYFLRVIDATTGAVVPIYADENSTPISSVSGKENLAQSDSDSMVSFYVTPANAYNLDLYAPDGETFLKRYPNVSMASTVGPQGPQGVPGTAGNVDADLVSLKAALVTDVARIYDHAVFKWTTGDYTGQADDVNIIESDNAALTVGAWVRQLAANIQTSDGHTIQAKFDRAPLQIDSYYLSADGDDWAPAFTRAYADGIAKSRNLVATAASSYRFLTSVDVWPNLAGWTPSLDLQGSTIKLGHDTVVTADEYAGWRVRGLKSGALANSIGFKLTNGTIDHNNIHVSNGSRGIWIENGSGWLIDGVNAINCYMGYHFCNWRYIDGGAVGTLPGVFKNATVNGRVLSSTSDVTWYPYSESGDLCTVTSGGTVAAGATELIVVIQTAAHSTNAPRIGVPTLYKNNTASPITVPATLTDAALTGAGLTNIGLTTTWQSNSAMPAVPYMYYSSGGTKIPNCPIVGKNHVMRDVNVYGSRYGGYVSACDGAVFERVYVDSGIRGIASEWSGTNGKYLSCTAVNPLSSGFLLGYGSSGWTVNDNLVSCLSSRWVGEALFNIQLSCGNLYGRRNRTVTRSSNTPNAVGQCHIHIAINTSNVDLECDMTGDCSKAYVAIESAWSTAVTTVPELYATASGFQGGASQDMSNIKISGSITPQSDKATGAGATMIALMQVADEVNGEIGLSSVDVTRLRAGSSKIPVRYYKIYEGSTAAKQVNNCALIDVEFPIETVPSTAAARIVLPRRWAHFRNVKNATNLDDNTERTVDNVATPDLTFGKYWYDPNATTMTGILGGQGASSSEGYEGREIIVRGNSSRAWTTISGTSGTKDGLRITGSPVTPTNVQRLRLTFNRALISWIGGLV